MFERFDADTSGIATTLCYHSFQCPCISKWTHLSCQRILVQPNLFNTSPMQRYHVYPKNLIHLACDAFGVLPPVSKLKLSQTMYHFISGYTALAQLQGQSKSTVAVKKLSSHLKEKEKLEQDIKFLYALNHTNVIKLFDCHIEKDLQLLVYEYMENKSLEDALSVESNTRSLKYTWDTRFNICLGIARGLKYLHDLPRLNIAHMNIKADNILLDGNLEPKISDFGLAHLYAEEDQFKVIKREVSQGYMAPEYFQGILTSKADVYSFGVILLEIVSWKKNVIKSNHVTEVLVNMAHTKHEQGNIEDMVDKTLRPYNTKQALTILELAVKCTSIAPDLRPTMSDVVSVLDDEKTIADLFKSSPNGGEKIKGSVDLTHADSTGTTSMDLTSIPSTSSLYSRAKDELESMQICWAPVML